MPICFFLFFSTIITNSISASTKGHCFPTQANARLQQVFPLLREFYVE
jgi:hypothetical protein